MMHDFGWHDCMILGASFQIQIVAMCGRGYRPLSPIDFEAPLKELLSRTSFELPRFPPTLLIRVLLTRVIQTRYASDPHLFYSYYTFVDASFEVYN